MAANTTETNTDNLPDPEKALPEIIIYGHSTLLYWWPVWVAGYIMAAVTYFKGGVIELDEIRSEYFYNDSALGVTYLLILFFVILFTNIRVRGVYSLAFALAIAFLVVLIAWMGFWDEIFSFIPTLSVHMNMGFYLVFSTLLLTAWLLMFFIFDRMVFWRVRPGQLTEEHVIGGGEQSYDARGMLFEQHGDDLFRHVILGLGAGDLSLITSGARQKTIKVQNVLFAERKVKKIQKLVAVEPNDLLRD